MEGGIRMVIEINFPDGGIVNLETMYNKIMDERRFYYNKNFEQKYIVLSANFKWLEEKENPDKEFGGFIKAFYKAPKSYNLAYIF